MKQRTIIISTPLITIPAGVSNHYLGLRPYFSEDVIYNQYTPGHYIMDKVKVKPLGKIVRLVTMSFDVLKFIILLLYYKSPLVLLNSSFGETALRRDVFFLRIAKLFGCRVVVFIHGWDKEHLNKVSKNNGNFSSSWKKADAFFVLALEFKKHLEKLGIQAPVHLTTTKVNDKLLEAISEDKKIVKIQTILFLARVEKAKGIFTTIEAFSLLKQKYPNLELRVVGAGKSLKEAKDHISTKNIQDIAFTGPLSGNELVREFLGADLYILPTTHGEGMPTSLLEAMAFGLPVITRPVGGLVDFFVNDKMGYMLESLDPEDYASHIAKLIENVDLAQRISLYNRQYAKEHFLASEVAQKIELTLKSI